MTGYTFISYSRVDRDYVEMLVDHLNDAGIPLWYDYSIPSGARFERYIDERVQQCSAFLVVMTPDAYESEWVASEVSRARHLHKPILPLLLAGDPFFSLGSRDYENVVGGILPSRRFMRTLQEHLGIQPTASTAPPSRPEPTGGQYSHDVTLDLALVDRAPIADPGDVAPPAPRSTIKDRQRAAARARLEKEMAERAEAERRRRRAISTLGISKLVD